MSASDADLARRSGRGDAAAFGVIVDCYERRVWAVCLRVCGNPDDARDASQEAFITAMRAIGGFRGEAQLATWLHRIAVNASLDLLRRRTRRGTQPLEAAQDRPEPAPGPEERAIGSQRAAEVRRALARLSEEHRTVIVLHDLEDLPYPEVAEILGVPLGTVKSRLHRARIELAALLGHLREPQREGAIPDIHTMDVTRDGAGEPPDDRAPLT